MPRKPRALPRRLALWMCGMMLAGIAVFAVCAYIAVYLEEEADVAAGVEQDAAASARAQIIPALAIAAPLAVALSLGAAVWASRRLISPIERATRTAAAISVDRFDRRMDVPDDSVELRALAIAINDLLDRLQRGYLALAAFSADASHELRTPIAAVSSELETALRRPRTATEWEASARTSLAELHRLGHLVGAMLRFAQADATRDSDATRVDLADVVEDVAAVQLAAAAKAGVALRVAIAAHPPVVRGDADLLGTAIANLVGNAVRLTPRGGEVIVTLAADAGGHGGHGGHGGDGAGSANSDVNTAVNSVDNTVDIDALRAAGAAAADADAGDATIVVDDTGPGLPANRNGLFVPFALAGPGGVGLGLAITRRIVERHGGTIAATDRPGGGARFTIRLPRAPSP